MAIQGDIDLTEKLDFRVDKKEKLLPSTELKSRALKSMESVAERSKLPASLDIPYIKNAIYYPAISTEDGGVITYSFPHYTSTATNSFTFRTTNNWSWTTYPTEFNTVSYYSNPEYIDPSYGITVSYTNSNVNNITTWNFKYDLGLEESIASCEENFSLNDKREKDYSLNRSCYDNDFVLGDRRTKLLADLTKMAFNSELIEDARGYYYDPDHYQYQGILWDSKEDEEDDPYSWNQDVFDAIPWFDRMRNSRIRRDYIDSLNDVEQNFDSYLTNYSWLGLY